jgi:hypothetical protein
LPAANRLSGSGALMTNQSMRPEWQNLPTALDDQFNVIATKKISMWGTVSGDYFLSFSNTAPPKLYQMKGEDFL